MKNVIKKIAAIALVFTLFGTGTTISKPVNNLKVHAASAASATCMHSTERSVTVLDFHPVSLSYITEINGRQVKVSRTVYVYQYRFRDYCPKCGITFGTNDETVVF
ncbi:MAG: hypothetical protein IJL67_13680 [Oscillospiraceae bacterium]|nr:hypothetical protein [Oscillospiraceae bacterium]